MEWTGEGWVFIAPWSYLFVIIFGGGERSCFVTVLTVLNDDNTIANHAPLKVRAISPFYVVSFGC